MSVSEPVDPSLRDTSKGRPIVLAVHVPAGVLPIYKLSTPDHGARSQQCWSNNSIIVSGGILKLVKGYHTF